MRTLKTSIAFVAALIATPAFALDATWSGFATLGYAGSDSPYTFQGSINDHGTFRRDSLVAGQLDLHFSQPWSATVQAQVVPSPDHDERWTAKAAWAFVAWRPDNDWLLRGGKMRMPLYLYSESLDVGVASDMARLPYEMYSIAPTNDFSGLYLTRSFGRGARDYAIDVYDGTAHTALRLWLRDGQPPEVPAGASYDGVYVRVRGLVLTSRGSDLTWRLGVHATSTRRDDGEPLPQSYPRVDLGQGLSFWQLGSTMPGPGVPMVGSIHNLALTAGAEWQIDENWRLAGEFVRMLQRDTQLGSDSAAGYIALFRHIDAWTPYLSAARQHSSAGLLQWRSQLMAVALPAQIPGAAQINAAEHAAGDSIYAADQYSLALGASYTLSPKAKLKAEWMATHVGRASAHFDTPPGLPDAHNMHVNNFTLNFSVAF